MSERDKTRPHERWAHLRFSVVGPLLASPPRRGELQAALRELAAKEWQHPITGQRVQFGVSTLERWFYLAKRETRDPVGVLRRRVRQDAGTHRGMSAPLRPVLVTQYQEHETWSYRLHTDNLAVLVEQSPELGPMPSYSTVRRFMKAHDLLRKPPPRKERPGEERTRKRLESREMRSYEAEYVGSLWHLDYHHCSRKVLRPDGSWETPVLLGILDDYSRLACHVQWYLGETAENLIHGLCQAFQKRDLPRGLLSDNGSAMVAAETEAGLTRLSILHSTTLPYHPAANGKQESFWGRAELRLMPMIEGCEELTLPFLNEATQAWVEMEYNRTPHGETGVPPLERFSRGKDVSRPCPGSEELRQAFLAEVTRKPRRSDGTVSLEGVRFEIPDRYRRIDRVWLRYASWDLSHVYLADGKTGSVLCRLFPLDKTSNADGERRRRVQTLAGAEHAAPPPASGLAPLMKKLLAEYAATGLPPAYLPKDEHDEEEDR